MKMNPWKQKEGLVESTQVSTYWDLQVWDQKTIPRYKTYVFFSV